MRARIPLGLLAAGLLSAAAMASEPAQEPDMKPAPTTATAPAPTVCDTSQAKPHKGNGGYAKGPNARAVGGSGNVGRDTGNGGVAIGPNADASGGDANRAERAPCDGRTRLGNGGNARGDGARATGGSGNVVRF
jgi:hypothetical protein